MARTILDEFKAAFERRGWTYKEVAERLEMSQTSAYRKLNGEQVIGLDELPLFARVLGVKVQISTKGAA